MRKFLLITLCLLLGLLAGCSALQTEFRDEHGRALDHPYGDEPVIVKVRFQQNYNGWVAVSVDGGPRVTVPYGQSFSVEMRSKKVTNYEIWWAEWVGSDNLLHGTEHQIVGLYTGETIIIDEFLLRGWTKIEVVIYNSSSQVKTFSSMQGGSFTLRPQEEKTLFVVAGDFDLTWNDNKGNTVRGRRQLLAGHKVPWKNRAVDAVIAIHDFIPNMTQRRILRNGGYLRL